MKTNLFFRLLALFLVFAATYACQEKIAMTENVDGTKVKLKVVVPVEETRVTSSNDESKISNYQVYVFDDQGVLESYVNQTGSDIVLDCIAGNKTVAVLANAPVLNDVATWDALAAKTSLLSHNSVGAFVMAGQQSVSLTSDKEVSISVSRLVSKIRLSSLQLSFEAPQYQSATFKVASVYLINVPAETRYFSNTVPTTWYNKQKYLSTDANTLIYDDMKSVTVTSSSPYSTTNTFYCYPNPSDQDSFSQTWSARHTRLVVEAYLGNNKYFYPVTLPKLEKNKIYDVKLTITRPGTSVPDDEVDKYAADFTISVKAWETGSTVTEEI